tara:strand:- start:138 stop:779 length:642 start_codon:yes stop_codon:yes gene_type:complete
MNKHILMVMDKESFTKDELKKNKESADAAAAYAAAYAADYVDYAADYVDYGIDMYFKKTGENKQDYIDEIKRVKESVKEETLEYTQDMADNGVLPSVGMECRFDTTFFTTVTSNRGTCEIIAYYDGKVWINIIDFDCVINLNVIDFKPLTPPKTDKEKAIDDLDKVITTAYQDKIDSYVSSSRFKSEARVLLDQIIKGNVAGVSFQPLTVEVK